MRMDNTMASVFSFTVMELGSMKVTSKMVNRVATGETSTTMVASTRVLGKITRNMVLASSNTLMETFTRVNLWKTTDLVMAK